MCGFGLELRPGRAPDRAALERMHAVLAHRGPDGDGIWLDGHVGLVHRRLAIIDLSELGAQPMREDGLVVAFNGCIYNHHELRGELERLGHAFRSTSDTEVILRGWREWGEGVLDRLKGMFAFALVDERSGRTVLVRDRLGIKPLYLADLPGGGLRAASTVQAILAAGDVDTSVDPVALHHYLSWHSVVPAPRTILRGVRKLAPATVLTIEADGRRRERVYWNPAHTRAEERSEAEWAEALLDALRVAVKRRMVSDVPVGVLLSGGIDSSLIVALLAEQGQKGLATFSIGFPDVGDREGDEFEFSDLVAREFETDHRQIRVEVDELLAALPHAIGSMSEPMVSHDCVAFWLLAENVKRDRSVVQSGQGADEILGGYSWYPPMLGASGTRHRHLRGGVLRPRPRGRAVAREPGRGARRRRLAGLRDGVVLTRGRGHARGPGAAPGRADHAGRRPGQARRQHDDGPRARGPGAVPRPRARRAGGRLPARAQARRTAARASSSRPRAASCPTR